MYIQINIPEELNKKISVFKINRNLNTKQEAILKIVEEYFKKEEKSNGK